MHKLPTTNIMTQFPKSAGLKNEIEKSFRYSHQTFGSVAFLWENDIRRLTKRRSIEEVLMEHGIQASHAHFIETNAARVFLTSVYCELVKEICGFISDGFCDEYLPITQEFGGPGGSKIFASKNENPSLPLSTPWKCFSSLRPRDADYFIDKQWLFLAPIFRGPDFYRRLDSRRPLPFTNIGDISSGRFSTVHRIEIPGTYVDGDKGGDGSAMIAVKQFRSENPKFFEKEVGLLQKIRAKKHNYLIQPIAAFENGIHQCVLFPWCKGGNLRAYWAKFEGHSKNELLSWTLSQMAGLCSCLKWLWDLNFRHGDLKPENILHSGDANNFLIADVGISKIHIEATEMRIGGTSTKFTTIRYESPEFKPNYDSNKPYSRDCDVWAMGALLLEWLVWLLNYSKGVDTLNTVKTFWIEDETDTFHVNHKCRKLMKQISEKMEAETPGHRLKHLLDLIQQRLLVVKLASEDRFGRAKAPELSRTMDDIVKNSSYSAEPITYEGLCLSDDDKTSSDDNLATHPRTLQRPDQYNEANR